VHNHSKHNCIIFKGGVNDPGLAFAGKVGLGPFWTWALLDLGPGLELRLRTAALGRHLHLLLPARAYVYRRIFGIGAIHDLIHSISGNELQRSYSF
jgi:hypothetical protein